MTSGGLLHGQPSVVDPKTACQSVFVPYFCRLRTPTKHEPGCGAIGFSAGIGSSEAASRSEP